MKRGQEEIVGFVIIVVIVALIGVFFLGFSLRNDNKTVTESSEVSQFLSSMLEYTGNCSLGYEGHDTEMGRNIADCSSNSADTCISGENVCDAAKNTAKTLLKSAFIINNETAITGYEFNAEIDGSSKSIINITEGDCSGSYKASDVPYRSTTGNKIRVSLKVCS